MLQLTQPSIEQSVRQDKRRKLSSGKYFPTEPSGAAGKEVAGDDAKLAGGDRLRQGLEPLL